MLKRGIILFSEVLTGALLLAGCAAKMDVAPSEGTPIGFCAGSTLLRDDALVKSGTPKDGTSFTATDQIAIYGWHKALSAFMTFGSTAPVELGNNGAWTYSPLKFWQWQGDTDYYDFLALYPNDCGQTVTSDPLKATFTYDPTSAQYDIMTATYRRKATDASPCDAVPLTFNHRLAAVRVKVTNAVGGQTFQLESCHFRYLIVGASASVTYKNNSQVFSWSDYVRSSSDLLGSAPECDLEQNTYVELDYDLMIPQALDPLGYVPSLVLTYKPKTGDSTYGDSITSKVILKEILSDEDTSIDEWKAGVLYTYNIVIRIGGGIIVDVVTTPWDEVDAETPGIMI